MPPDDQTYAAAGVSLATAEAVVDRLRAAVESTRTPAVVGSFGAFAGLFAIDERRLLAASTDSVGSKLVLARRAGKLRWCGADLAAHGINDVLTTGAEPLFFLDYVAANTIDPEQVAELVEGAADVCRAAGCAILGGETAELPGIYRDEELDFCGTVVGLVDRDDVVDGSRAQAWRPRRRAALGGNPRKRLLARPAHRRRRSVRCRPAAAADPLLPRRRPLAPRPRRRPGARARDRRRHRGEPRARPPGGRRRGRSTPRRGERPAVFAWLAEHGVPEDELRRVFNIGIGYCAVVPAADVEPADLVIGRLEAGVDGVEWSDA